MYKYCVNEYLQCRICKKHFHRKCLKISKKAYEDMKKTKFICSSRCYNFELPLSRIDDIDFFSYLLSGGIGNSYRQICE